MGRTISIRHRVKQTVEGEARPTQVAILDEGTSEPRLLDLETETDELDFMLGRFPTAWRDAANRDELKGVSRHHLRTRKIKQGEDTDALVLHQNKGPKGPEWKALRVPIAFEGLRAGDKVVMVLGGSGDNFAYALSKRGEEISATVHRVPPFILEARRDGKKDDDAKNLIALFRADPDAFFLCEVRDRKIIVVRETWRAREEAMKARLASEARLRSRFIGGIFRSAEGRYPEGLLEDAFDAQRANDVICEALRQEQNTRDREMASAVGNTEVWQEVLANVVGCGPAIAARLIASIQDIRRFSTPSKLRAYCGVHVMNGGEYGERQPDKQFPRRRSGEVANWSEEARQALYLLGDQLNRRPESQWGKRLRTNKIAYRGRRPSVVCKQCNLAWTDYHEKVHNGHTRVYTDAHIHKMSVWRTLSEFTTWLFYAWWKLYGGAPTRERPQPDWVAQYGLPAPRVEGTSSASAT